MITLRGKKLAGQLGSYLVASCVGTAGHYLVLFGLVQGAGLDPVVASTCGALTGAVIIYLLSYFMVFKSGRRHREAFARFLLIAVLGIVLNGLVFGALSRVLPWHYLVLQVVTTMIVFLSNFSLNRCWTFASPGCPEEPAAKPCDEATP